MVGLIAIKAKRLSSRDDLERVETVDGESWVVDQEPRPFRRSPRQHSNVVSSTLTLAYFPFEADAVSSGNNPSVLHVLGGSKPQLPEPSPVMHLPGPLGVWTFGIRMELNQILPLVCPDLTRNQMTCFAGLPVSPSTVNASMSSYR